MERTLADVVLSVLSKKAPDELADFSVVVAGFDASPRAHRRAQRGADEDSASMIAASGEVLSGIVLAVGADMAKDLLKDGLVSGVKSGWGRFRRRLRSNTTLPALSDDRVEGFRLRAAALFVEYGAPGDRAGELADELIEQWPSAPG